MDYSPPGLPRAGVVELEEPVNEPDGAPVEVIFSKAAADLDKTLVAARQTRGIWAGNEAIEHAFAELDGWWAQWQAPNS